MSWQWKQHKEKGIRRNRPLSTFGTVTYAKAETIGHKGFRDSIFKLLQADFSVPIKPHPNWRSASVGVIKCHKLKSIATQGF